MRETKDTPLERISDYRINEMMDHLQEIDREECGIDREHMHTLRCLIGSYSDLWEHIKRTGGVETSHDARRMSGLIAAIEDAGIFVKGAKWESEDHLNIDIDDADHERAAELVQKYWLDAQAKRLGLEEE